MMKTAKASPRQKAVPIMREIKRILVPIDFSDISLAALRQARLFAEKFGAELVLLHVIETYPIDYMVGLPDARQMNKSLEETAEARLNKLAQTEGPARTLVRWGKPFHEIVNTAEKLAADLIVLPTHGYTGIKHAYLGSTAERVVRHAHCPVLVVRAG